MKQCCTIMPPDLFLTNPLKENPYLESNSCSAVAIHIPPFSEGETEGSLCSQKANTGSYYEPDESNSNPHPHTPFFYNSLKYYRLKACIYIITCINLSIYCRFVPQSALVDLY